MCVVIDLDVVCLVCLQPNKEMHPIFTTDHLDNSELQIAQKISILSELKTDQNNQTLPSKICSKCLQDLKAAWRFRKNCQAAVTIFQTIGKLDPRVQLSTEDVAAKELAVQEIKVPKGLQIKRIKNSANEGDASKKAGESLARKKTEAVVELVINTDKVGSTLYDELAPHDYVQNTVDETEEFQTMEVEEETGEANDEEDEQVRQQEQMENDEEHTFVEYYITEEPLTDETCKVERKISLKPKNQIKETAASTDTEEIETKLTEYLENINKPQPRGRTRRQVVQKEVGNKRGSQALQKRLIVDRIVIDSANSSEESNKPAQPEVRQVKTRKRRSISPETKSPKICDLCGNSYRYQHALNAHMRRHYNEKPFPCDFCDKAFVSNVELRRHMRVHTGQKPYACQYCDRRFSDFGSRIKHERTHTGERPYHCPTCGKSFAYPHVLSVHVLTHTGEKRFRCNFCSKGFTKKAYLLSHVEQHHNNVQVVIDNSTTDDTSQNQMEPKKSQGFEECIYTTEFVNEEDIPEGGEYEEDDSQEIIITQSLIQPKMEAEADEDEMHEIVEVEPEEYTIGVR